MLRTSSSPSLRETGSSFAGSSCCVSGVAPDVTCARSAGPTLETRSRWFESRDALSTCCPSRDSVAWGSAAQDRPDRELLLNLIGGTSAIGSETFLSGNLVTAEFVTSIVEALLPQMPSLRAEWAKVAYRWAVLTKDKDISLVSWQIFSFLNEDTSYTMMKGSPSP